MKNAPFILILPALLLTLLLAPTTTYAEDAEGCKDSPLVTRFPGSTINSCENKEFDQFEMPVGKNKDGETTTKTFEGEFHSWDYATRDGLSEIQVYRNFQTALKAAGFTIDYEASPDTLTAHKGNAWYMLESKGTFYYQTIVLTKDLQQEVAADASSLQNEIDKTGHVAVYGIHFATGQATIQPDSEKTLTEIAKLLTGSPALKLRVEGYTDNVGQAVANQSLSEKRAQAVVAWLTSHGVAAARLAAKGLGPANPVADNSTEDGRAENRRVELVKM
jgi:outer membrane protein OmpA-like peptidoglycan-associated protein